LAATARDWARLGLLQADGSWNGVRVVSPEWVAASSRPERAFLAPGRLPSTITTHAGFGYHWWPMDDEGHRLTADGSRGQFAAADRRTGAVVVKTSLWPYDDFLVDRQARDLSYLGLHALLDGLTQNPTAKESSP
jgi:CubicO group peptidase (beta-lactamase class C family)